MDRVRFSIDGAPQGKGRPRVTKRGVTYTPAETRSYEAEVRAAAIAAMAGHPPFDGACAVEITATFAIPTSWKKARQLRARLGFLLPCVKPDGDNVIKIICDPLGFKPKRKNRPAEPGVCWHDDTQATDIRLIKRYGEKPGVTVSIVHLSAAERGVEIVPIDSEKAA